MTIAYLPWKKFKVIREWMVTCIYIYSDIASRKHTSSQPLALRIICVFSFTRFAPPSLRTSAPAPIRYTPLSTLRVIRVDRRIRENEEELTIPPTFREDHQRGDHEQQRGDELQGGRCSTSALRDVRQRD